MRSTTRKIIEWIASLPEEKQYEAIQRINDYLEDKLNKTKTGKTMIVANVSIDLTKLDKSRIKNHENGSKYYSMDITINDEKNQYGQDVAVATTLTKEEREGGMKRTYIGNGKVIFKKDPEPKYATGNTASDMDSQPQTDSELPF